MTKQDCIAEGFDEYELDRAEKDAREDIIHWATELFSWRQAEREHGCDFSEDIWYVRYEMKEAIRRMRKLRPFLGDAEPHQAACLDLL